MINVTQEYLNVVSHYQRSIITRVYFNGSETPIQNSELIRVQVKELGQSTDALTLGDLCTNEATVKFIMPSVVIPLEGGYFRLEHGVMVEGEYNYVSVGTFYISQIETVEGSGIYTVTGYDRSKRLEVEYTPKVTSPTTVELIVKDICTQCNIALDSSFTFPNIPIETLYTASCKDTIKYMAGLMGKNAKINRNDKLTFYWYASSGIQINRSMQYMGGFKKTTDEDIVINSLTSGTEENPLVSGDGRGISFENPYMTQSILDSIYSKLKGFTYTPSNTKYNGNPTIEIGDIVSVEDKQGNYHNCIVSGHDLVLTGMHGTITSKGTTEADTVMKQESPTEIKLKKFYNVMLNAFKESTDLIIGAKGGYIVTNYDDNGFPTSFEIRDTPTLTDNTKLWIFNKNGIGFSSDGGKTLSNIAIDMLGRINANAITTGKLVGENFEIDLDEGSLTMGERGSDGEFKTVWFKVDSKGITQKFTEELNERVGELEEKVTISGIKSQYGVSTFKTTEPTEWAYSRPDVNLGEYLWMREEYTFSDGSIKHDGTRMISAEDGENATLVRIDSSRGTVFKNNNVSTVLTAVIYYGATRIEDIQTLRKVYGNGAYIQWSWQRLDEETFGTILSSDSRITNDGFCLVLGADDVDVKVTFKCDICY